MGTQELGGWRKTIHPVVIWFWLAREKVRRAGKHNLALQVSLSKRG